MKDSNENPFADLDEVVVDNLEVLENPWIKFNNRQTRGTSSTWQILTCIVGSNLLTSFQMITYMRIMWVCIKWNHWRPLRVVSAHPSDFHGKRSNHPCVYTEYVLYGNCQST